MGLETNSTERHLLATMTNEFFQPVRLYYSIPSQSYVTKKFQHLQCMGEVPSEQCWQWLFDGEAKSLQFAVDYNEIPEEKRPIVLGRFRFPMEGSMTFQTNSVPRAIEAAKFFGLQLGSKVIALRCRLVNRFFAAEEGQPNELFKTLDRDVTVIDIRLTEEKIKREFANVRTKQDIERIAKVFRAKVLASKEDVPLVEDFPLAPEEETSDFLNLANMLKFRTIRAFEHWNGNTHLTLSQIIIRIMESPT